MLVLCFISANFNYMNFEAYDVEDSQEPFSGLFLK